MLERKESSVTIFRGDDTGGQLGKTIVINFHCGDTVNMEGVVVTFVLGGFYEKEFHNVHDGDRLEIFMTHEQTAMLPLGVSFGKLYGTDASGKIRTFSNRIPIRVTNRVCEAYGSAEESEIDVTISNAITWDSIFGKPETFPPSEHRHQKSDIDNLESDLKTLSDGVESAIEAAEATKTEVDAKADKSALQAEVDRAQTAETQLTTKANDLGTAKADKAIPSASGNLAELTADGNLADSGKKASDFLPASSSFVGSWDVYDTTTFRGEFSVGPNGDLLGITYEHGSLYKFDDKRWYYGESQDPASEIAVKGDISALESSKADRASLALEYSATSAYSVGSIVYHDGNIYQCTTAIAEGGEAWTAAHWQLMKLSDFFTESNSLLTGTIDARLPYPLYAVPSTGVLKDRALNTTSLASVTVPDNFTDLLIRASVASSLSVTMPGAIATKYGDTFPGEAGEYLITITKTGAAEAYVRTIKLEVANA